MWRVLQYVWLTANGKTRLPVKFDGRYLFLEYFVILSFQFLKQNNIILCLNPSDSIVSFGPKNSYLKINDMKPIRGNTSILSNND
jgi:hypothetical protein